MASASGAAPNKSTNEGFVGTWHVHGGTLLIESDTFGVSLYSDAGTDVQLLSLVLSHDKREMHVTTTGVGYISGQTGESAPLPDPTESFKPGDSFTLVFVEPHLMKMVNIRTHFQVVGNPYWCGVGLAARDVHFCGA
jgi:hypothetical protein